MGDFIAAYWQEGLFLAFVAFFAAAYKKLHKEVCDQKNIKDGMLALLRSEIIRSYEKYRDQEWIPIYAMENVLEMYDAYHALGGNGTMTKLVDELKELQSKAKIMKEV